MLIAGQCRGYLSGRFGWHEAIEYPTLETVRETSGCRKIYVVDYYVYDSIVYPYVFGLKLFTHTYRGCAV